MSLLARRYMCQINLNPMKAQVGYLRVVVPPDIIDEESSNDVTVVEGANVTLKCKAKGYPQPDIEVSTIALSCHVITLHKMECHWLPFIALDAVAKRRR